MIGQKNLLNILSKQIDTFPRFSIFVGSRGSEKNEIAVYLANLLKAVYVNVPDCKVETIRDVITSAYKVRMTTVYNIKDADLMSIQARNALLKVTEEPPNNAYFVMTLEDVNNTLPTIKSRGSVYVLEPYTCEELTNYCQRYDYTLEELNIVLKLCETPGEIDLLNCYQPMKFYNFVGKVVDNIATVSGSNAFKIAQSVRFKDTEEGYDLTLFWKAFCATCMESRFYNGLKITSKYLSSVSIKSVNKAMLFDGWILEIREAWTDGSN